MRACIGRGRRGTDDGGLLSVGVACAALRDYGPRVSCEQSSNARPDHGVGETDLATKNTAARGKAMWVIKLTWGGGLWMSFVTVETETDTGKCGSGCDRSSKESERWLAPEGW